MLNSMNSLSEYFQNPGPVDGVAGDHTLSALAQFQAQQGAQQTTVIDEDLVA